MQHKFELVNNEIKLTYKGKEYIGEDGYDELNKLFSINTDKIINSYLVFNYLDQKQEPHTKHIVSEELIEMQKIEREFDGWLDYSCSLKHIQ